MNGKELDTAKIEEDAAALGVRKSKVSMTGFNNKKGRKPVEIEREEKRVKKKVNSRLAHMVDKKKAEAKMKPIDKRRALLIARLKAVKSQKRPNTYSVANIKAWMEELEAIDRNPKSWTKLTNSGKAPFQPSNKRKVRTALELLEGIDLD